MSRTSRLTTGGSFDLVTRGSGAAEFLIKGEGGLVVARPPSLVPGGMSRSAAPMPTPTKTAAPTGLRTRSTSILALLALALITGCQPCLVHMPVSSPISIFGFFSLPGRMCATNCWHRPSLGGSWAVLASKQGTGAWQGMDLQSFAQQEGRRARLPVTDTEPLVGITRRFVSIRAAATP
jgi:hypothetical protein